MDENNQNTDVLAGSSCLPVFNVSLLMLLPVFDLKNVIVISKHGLQLPAQQQCKCFLVGHWRIHEV